MEEHENRIRDDTNYRKSKIDGNKQDTRSSHYTTIHLRLNSKHARMLDDLSDRWGYQRTYVLRELIIRESERRSGTD